MFNPVIFIGTFCCILLQNTAIPASNKDSGKVVKVIFLTDPRPEEASSDTLFYHQRAIKPEDFRASPRRSGPGKNEAISFTSFAFDGSSRQFRDTLEITLVLQVFWVKSSSWLRTRPPSAHTMEHEQLHFDITRLVAERFRKKVLQMPLTADDHESRIQYEYLESFRDMNRLQDEFDEKVHHGINGFMQQEWKRKIRQDLIAEGVQPAMQ